MLIAHIAMAVLVFAIVLVATRRPASFWTWVARQRWLARKRRRLDRLLRETPAEKYTRQLRGARR